MSDIDKESLEKDGLGPGLGLAQSKAEVIEQHKLAFEIIEPFESLSHVNSSQFFKVEDLTEKSGLNVFKTLDYKTTQNMRNTHILKLHLIGRRQVW